MTEPLPVNEIFNTIQGEGFWTGMPAVFVRLQGCEVGCPWCDTKHTWETGPLLQVPFWEMLSKGGDGAQYARADVSTIMEQIAKRKPGHVVITGGEPCKYDLTRLTTAIFEIGKFAQIETSGTQDIRAHRDTWITVSPKVGMPGGFKVLPDAMWMARELKMPVGKQSDIDELDGLLRGLKKGGAPLPFEVWLQPLSTSEKATALCVQVATERGWRVSLQTHKFVGLR